MALRWKLLDNLSSLVQQCDEQIKGLEIGPVLQSKTSVMPDTAAAHMAGPSAPVPQPGRGRQKRIIIITRDLAEFSNSQRNVEASRALCRHHHLHINRQIAKDIQNYYSLEMYHSITGRYYIIYCNYCTKAVRPRLAAKPCQTGGHESQMPLRFMLSLCHICSVTPGCHSGKIRALDGSFVM